MSDESARLRTHHRRVNCVGRFSLVKPAAFREPRPTKFGILPKQQPAHEDRRDSSS
jgi:hypothetical protein